KRAHVPQGGLLRHEGSSMISRRHTLALFAAAGSVPVVSALASCGPNTADSEQSGEVRIYWWGGDLRNTLTREALDLLEEGQHDVTGEAEYSVATGYWDKLATQTAGGDYPAVMEIGAAKMD